MNKVNYIDSSKRVVVGTRSDGASLLWVGKRGISPVFAIVEDGDAMEDIEAEPQEVFSISQILKFAQPDDWQINDQEYQKLLN